jgi:hypothetical protein
MLPDNETRTGVTMNERNGMHRLNELLSDLGAALAWIWMTPDEARRLLRQAGLGTGAKREVSFDDRLAA